MSEGSDNGWLGASPTKPIGLTNGGVTADLGGIRPPLPTLLGVMGPVTPVDGVVPNRYPGGVLPSGVIGRREGEAVYEVADGIGGPCIPRAVDVLVIFGVLGE